MTDPTMQGVVEPQTEAGRAMLDCPICQSGDIEHRHAIGVPEAARIKGVHAHTIRGAIHRGELRAARIGRAFILDDREVEGWQPRGVGRPRDMQP